MSRQCGLPGIAINEITRHLSYEQEAHTNSKRTATPTNKSVCIFIVTTTLGTYVINVNVSTTTTANSRGPGVSRLTCLLFWT